MTCKRFQHEMSLALDGRLPSRRRTILFAHRDACAPCTRVWEEMRSAQDLALSLATQPVSASFRTDLWARIRSGEGAPEMALREPIPLASKVRYVMSGAAVAACALFVLHLTRGEEAAPSPVPERVDEVAKVDETAGEAIPIATSRDLGVVPITPQLATETCVNTCTTVADQLQAELPALGNSPFSVARRELLPKAYRAGEAAGMVLWMDEEGFVRLEDDQAHAFSVLLQIASHVERAQNPNELRLALEPVRTLEPRKLKNVFVQCCDIEPKFQQQLGLQVTSNNRGWRMLFNFVPGSAPASGLDAMLQGQQVWLIRVRARDNQAISLGRR